MSLLRGMTLRDVFGRSESGTPFEQRPFSSPGGRGPAGPFGLGFGSQNTDIDRMDIDVSKFMGGLVYNPEDVEANPRTSANISFEDLIGMDTKLPTWDEIETLQKMMRSVFEPRNLGEAMILGVVPWDKRFRPLSPLQHYKALEALRANMQLAPDESDSGRLHGDSRWKEPTHPTRFGVDEPNPDVVTDRITGKPADFTDEQLLEQFLRNLPLQFRE